MPRQNYETLKELWQKENIKGHFLQHSSTDPNFARCIMKVRKDNTIIIEKNSADIKMHNGIYIDIFPCDNAANSSFGRRLQFVSSKIIIAKSLYKRGYETKSIIKKAFMLLCRFIPQKPFLKIVKGLSSNSEYLHTFFAAASDFNKNVIKKSVFEDSIGADFEDSRFLIPKGYHELLTKMYGDYMLIPDENERAKKQHAVFVDTKNSYTKYRDLHKNLKFDNYTKSIR
jgi:lipopolysaccharide cholinephosphotransferase